MRYVWILLFVLVLFSACQEANKQVVDPITNIGQTRVDDSWIQEPLVRLDNQQTIRVSDYVRPVALIPSSTWCSVCLEQVRVLEELEVAVILLNIDTQESDEQMRAYAQENDLSIPVINAKDAYVEKLVKRFGYTVLNFNQAPIILRCSGTSTILGGGLKNTQQIQETLRNC